MPKLTGLAGDFTGIFPICIWVLPPRCREVFWLCRIDGKNHRQVALDINISVRHVEYLMNQALKLLKGS